MTPAPIYIAATGIISPLGRGLAATEQALWAHRSAIVPLQIFPLLQAGPLPVGQISDLAPHPSLPRTHQLAREAAQMAMQGCTEPPDAIILGCTTGGILTTEQLLRDKSCDRQAYGYHGLLSVARDVAEACGCPGPALMLSTACSSSAVALALAMSLLREGRMRRILAGGVDSLSRLTYFGFHSLQLVDRNGCRPFDLFRQGTTVAEGAAMLLLTTERPESPLAVLLGAGLSCDAYHPAAPHPEGRGALAAMQAALADACLPPSAVDYISLHGTGTRDNDTSEAKAIRTLFPSPPPLSSIKGAMGHSLGAAGAIEAVVSGLVVSRGFLPGNAGCDHVDPALGLEPQIMPKGRPVRTVLSNSFGFGGNNGALVIGREDMLAPDTSRPPKKPLAIHGCACLTGAGLMPDTLARLRAGGRAAGMPAMELLGPGLPPRFIRRAKRLTRLSLQLAASITDATPGMEKPSAIFMGTGWGSLTETCDFLTKLDESAEQFPSPTDFVGSVHNSPASQIAILLGATGANVTLSGGDYSFEQALLAADSLLEDSGRSALLLSADEGHARLSPLLDPSVDRNSPLADGGGALYVNRDRRNARCLVRLPFYGRGAEGDLMERLIETLGGPENTAEDFAAVFAGIPAGTAAQGDRQLADFRRLTGGRIPVCRYRDFLGQFASASAVAAVLAVAYLKEGMIPGALLDGDDLRFEDGRKILVLGTGNFLTAMEFSRP
ncbi:MAG: beta-ketoacyl synthase N-terminal-like domain-containing protein [Desulfocapsaceae bacterium]|nr:beta-ketoacyl synthase N-terminal-like domain-containing protein [Desulfocapsaceae bacterium]